VRDVEFRPAPMVGKDLSCRPQVVLGYGPSTSVLPVLVLAPEVYHHPALVGSPEGGKFHATLATSSSLNLPAQAQRCEVVNEALPMNSTKYLRGWENLGEPSLFIIELKANIRHHRRPDFSLQDAL
jgi:hypothetical protein